MRNVNKLLVVLLLSVVSFATTITGTIRDSSGQLWNGSITFAPNASVIDYISHEVVPSVPIQISVINGSLYMTNGSATVTLKGNDTFLPSNTAYYALFKDVSGQPINLYLYSITGTTYDLGTAIPTPVTTTNISYGNLLGLNSVTIKPSSTSVTQLGIQTASAANIFSVVNNKVMVGNLLSGNSLMQLFGTSGTSLAINPVGLAGPFLTILDSGSSINSGGGFIFGSNSTQFGAAVKYALTTNTNNSQGNLMFFTRKVSTDTNLSQQFSIAAANIVVGVLPGTAGGGGGINSDGGGFKHQRASTCTTGAGANATCTFTLTWATAFADNAYTATCTIDSGTAIMMFTGTRLAGSMAIQITNGPAGGAANGFANCIAVHD